ncbi:MAG: sigma-70 family RNA polymerase sigma factor [Planctomycetaceae bacterium]|jgi:RNA polymerase sigma-70 factor (ECF subfamily)|nr:sigma-70 family RNA polymerase sigma factor [Planctomycetaceae bacterium]
MNRLKTEMKGTDSCDIFVDNCCTDSELVDRVRLGETKAFDEIDHRYRETLYRFLLRFTFSTELAEELTQQTLIRAFEMIGQLHSGEKLAGWLHRIAFRMAVAEKRRKKTVTLDGLNEPATYSPNQLDLEEEKQNLWNLAKQHLSPEELTILLLRYRDDLSLSQIAEQLGKNEGAVRVQLHRARKKLQPFVTVNFY